MNYFPATMNQPFPSKTAQRRNPFLAHRLLVVVLALSLCTAGNLRGQLTLPANASPVASVRSLPQEGITSEAADIFSFFAIAAGSANRITWSVVTDYTADYYTVERSMPGSDQWESLAVFVASGKPEGQPDFTYFDTAPLPTADYRLRVLRADGSEILSPSVEVYRGEAPIF